MYMFSKGPIFKHKTLFSYILFIINITYPNEQTLEFNRQQQGSVDLESPDSLLWMPWSPARGKNSCS